jgi:hypothetical protein
MKRLQLAIFSFASLLLAPLSAVGEPGEEAVGNLIAEAIKSNPAIESLHFRTAELHELASISSTWADPRIAVEYMNAPVDTFSLQDHPMCGVQFTLQQRLPEWGWTRAAKAVAEHSVERSRYASDLPGDFRTVRRLSELLREPLGICVINEVAASFATSRRTCRDTLCHVLPS